MHDVVVVGSGLFGSIIARHLRRLRLDVCVVDDARPDSGSRPAGCVIRPSWVSSMSKPDLRDGLRLLDDYYGVQEVVFSIGAGRTVTCSRVEPSDILRGPDEVGRVMAIEMKQDGCIVIVDDKTFILGRRVIVAAGLWTPVLCPWVETWGKWGWSHRGPAIEKPVIKLWAPYRQVVAFNMDDGDSWSGDGSALVLKSAEKPEALLAAASRCADVIGWNPEQLATTRGVRPYAHHPNWPCLISRRGDVWAVTGGAKNGTIAAAWAARRLQEEMRL